MKFIHLSDLHLGKRVNEFSMLEDQEYILKEILNIIDDEKPDGILIAGDIYDKSIPSEDAVRLWDWFLNALAKRKLETFAISGNHDSAARFSNLGSLIEATGIHLSPEYKGEVKPYELADTNGVVRVYLLPFIKPIHVSAAFPDEEIKDYTDACRVAIQHMEVDESVRNVIVAHQFVVGATTCDSEELMVGGLDQVSAAVFDAFDYVALGHIHGGQRVSRDTLRYCGTPLKYSFSEKHHVKSVTIVEMGPKGEVEIREVPLVPRRDLREIKGTYEELVSKTNYEGTNTDDYIHAILTDEDDVMEAIGRLRTVYPNLMKLSYDNRRTKENQSMANAAEVEKKTPMELLEEFFEKQNNQPMDEEQRAYSKALMDSIWEV